MQTQETSSHLLYVQGRIWINSEKGPFIGKGRIELLRGIQKYGSITQAAKSMNMAYRHAWHLIESMNRKAISPLVITFAGGKGGGGATITDEAEKIIQAFETLEKEFEEFLLTKSKELKI
jgi:molybdate transport system regulatory protein